MTSDLERAVDDALSWLKLEAASLHFGELSITFHIHAGKLVRTERAVASTQLVE